MTTSVISVGAGQSELMAVYQFGAHIDYLRRGPFLFLQETTVVFGIRRVFAVISAKQAVCQ
jgi:hypothetical protein